AARGLLRASGGGAGDAPAGGEPTLRHRRAASAFALSTVPLLALLVYGLFGSPDLPGQPQAARVAAARGEAGDLAGAVARIEAHLARSPDDGRGWEVLAPVYLRVGRTDDAVKAYEAALRLLGDNAVRLSDYGEAVVTAGDGVVSDKARAAFEKALGLDPKAVKARFYLARAAEQDGDRTLARTRYAEIEASSPPDAPWLPAVRNSLARLDGRTPPAGPPGLSEEQASAVRGMVEGLDRRLAGQGGSPEEWGRLVRAYAVMGDRPRAQDALARARAALGPDPARLAPVEDVAREAGLVP
ncbi:tetratricopeptide repeat protein, partial [Methylobacterium oryzihabitans]